MTAPLAILATIAAGLLDAAIRAAWRSHKEAGHRRMARHARHAAVEQDIHRCDVALYADPGVRQRMLAGRIDAGQPIPSGWRW